LVSTYQKDKKVKVIPAKVLKEKDIQLAKISQDKVELEQKIPSLVESAVKEEVYKMELLTKKEAMRFNYTQRYNYNQNPDRKPLSDIPFSYLRRMAQIYPIARACINRRIRQITQLEWEITTIDEVENEKGYESQIEKAKEFFNHPMGPNTRLRELLTIMVDDLLSIDAISFEYQKTRGNEFMYLVPVDPTTIALRVTDSGATPQPPEPAYEQIIQGTTVAKFTTEEMLYDFMGNRSYSPYGFAPLESLILQAESAVQGALYNLGYFKENNIPEGFVTMPEEQMTTKEQIEEWQMWFDALLAGDQKMIHRLKFLPNGSVYTPAKKPEDMAFEKFELWLLQQTCAIFDVQPQDIGITINVNRATAESQSDIGKERGLIPLANFIKENFDELLHVHMGFDKLQFIWGNLNPVDQKEEAEIGKIQIETGQRSIDEKRIEAGLEPIGVDHFIMTSSGPMFVKDLIQGSVGPKASQESANKLNNEKTNENNQDEEDNEVNRQEKMERMDLRRWRKCIYRDIEKGKALRTKFPSEYIRPEIHKEIEEGLADVKSKLQAKVLFDTYLDTEINASMVLLKHARELRKLEQDAFA